VPAGTRSFVNSSFARSGQFSRPGGAVVAANRANGSLAARGDFNGFNGRMGNVNAARGNFNAVRGNVSGRYGNWNGARGNWHGHHDWDDYFNRGFVGGWGRGGYWPLYSGWDWGWGYPYAYSLYGYYPTVNSYDYYANSGTYPYDSYPYLSSYYYPATGSYSYAPDSYSYSGDNVAVAPGAAVPQEAEVPPQSAPATAGQQGSSDGLQYYSEARKVFLQGDYRNALRLAGHAELDAPTNPKVHELLSLALFALGNYPAAASEAHAAMAMGSIADWSDLYGYYNDVAKYTTELRALEAAAAGSANSSNAAAEHFLLGYHYTMIGARANAEAEFAEAAKLSPNDRLAGHYLKQLRANAPLTPPQIASAPQGQPL
jgi:hypothetical protein